MMFLLIYILFFGDIIIRSECQIHVPESETVTPTHLSSGLPRQQAALWSLQTAVCLCWHEENGLQSPAVT